MAHTNVQGEGHTFKADCQNNQTAQRFHVSLMCPESVKHLSYIGLEYSAWIRLGWMDGQDGWSDDGRNNNTPPTKISLWGRKVIP